MTGTVRDMRPSSCGVIMRQATIVTGRARSAELARDAENLARSSRATDRARSPGIALHQGQTAVAARRWGNPPGRRRKSEGRRAGMPRDRAYFRGRDFALPDGMRSEEHTSEL